MNNGSYFERRFGGGPRGKSVELPPEAVYSPPILDQPVDIDEIKTNAVSAMATENGATSEEVAELLDFITRKKKPNSARPLLCSGVGDERTYETTTDFRHDPSACGFRRVRRQETKERR